MPSASKNIYTHQELGGYFSPADGGFDPVEDPRTIAQSGYINQCSPKALLSCGRPCVLDGKPHNLCLTALWFQRCELGAETSVDVGPPAGEEPMGGVF
jgi:hypothetical protein